MTLKELTDNPIKVDLTDLVFDAYDDPADNDDPNDFTGRVLFWAGDDMMEEAKEYGKLPFYCGPEDASMPEVIHDSYDCGSYDKLEALFADLPTWGGPDHSFPYMDVGAAENFHICRMIDGISAEELWDFIKMRLERSGAILGLNP